MSTRQGGAKMSDYSNAVKKLNDDLLAFIHRYEILNDKEIFTPTLLARLKRLINSLNTTSNQYIATLEKQSLNFEQSFKKVLQLNKIEIEKIQNNLNFSLDVIKNKYIQKINLLNQQINDLKQSCAKSIDSFKQDIEFFIISSKQTEDIFKREYEENIKRYDYQIASAKETYNQSINTNNQKLEIKLAKIQKEYEESLKNYDISCDELMKKIIEKNNQYNAELTEVSNKLNQIRIQMKEKFRQESIFLNNEIKILVDEKNKSIDNARNTYTKALNDSQMEKENKKHEYQMESQKIQKDFVYNVTKLDDYMNEYKTNHSLMLEENQRKYYYRCFELKKRQEQEILKILSNNKNTSGDLDMHTKRLIKARNKYYYRLIKQYNRSEYKKTKKHELLYHKEIENIRSNKALLDLDRSYLLRKYSEKEQGDNKYYQEINGIYEIDMNSSITISNMRYNKKANQIKCQSRIRSKDLEKDLDISEANFQKKIEMIQSNINKYKYELKANEELKKIIHTYENNKRNIKTSYYSVINLLQTETNKLLNNYNISSYNLNVKTSKNNLNYGRKKLELENQRFEALNNIKINRANEALQRDIINTAYKIKENQIYETEDRNVQIRNASYLIDSINHTTLNQRFEGEIKIIHQILSTFIILIKEMELISSRILYVFLNSITINEDNFDIAKIFIKDFNQILLKYYSNLISSLNDQESEIIYKRIDFEEKFKFQIYYDDLLQTFEADTKRLTTKNKSISDTLENYSNTVETFQNRIYNLENQNNLIKQKISATHDLAQKNNLKNEYEKNLKSINEFYDKINEILKFKKILEHDYQSNKNELKGVDKDYNIRVKEIKKMQYNSAFSFYELKKVLSKFSLTVAQDLQDYAQNQKFDEKNIISNVNKTKNAAYKYNLKIFEELYKIINNFYDSTTSALKKDKKLLLIKFKHDINHVYGKTTILIEENKKEYDKKVSVHLEKIDKLDDFYNQQSKGHANILKIHNLRHEQDVKAILNENKNARQNFYKDYYAMCYNLEEIKKNFRNDLNELDNNFKKNKNDLTKKTIIEKNTISSNLETFIKGKNELINHLPQATKFQSQQLNKETREINAEIQTEIKETKTKYNLERKAILKTIADIRSSLEQILNEHDINHQKSINKEKKNHYIQLKHLEKNVKFYVNTNKSK